MRIVIIVCLLFFGLNSQAQAYKPMLAQFKEWHLTNCFSGCGTDIYYTDADTVVNGLTYAILDGFHYISRTFLLREDVGEKKSLHAFNGGRQNRCGIFIIRFFIAAWRLYANLQSN